ncbi:Ferric reduction oxidase 4 [Raphanus sativus]|uniref:ferric-chelate reductase (NADH) n=1 Tax=Raphanus sativus TaxID=3726 RepID=A0A6J0LEQ6_RAPSA|nr:ferric reduction oxidase 4 isoform X1 [Raphanus sativus]KAJ4887849.1 Ferric reduction oxidase 4 [Raphanus sativus]
MGDMRNLLKMLMVAVFVGWMFIWVMVSTDLFKKQMDSQMAKYFNTTYFGPQGINLVLLTVPMMFIAVLSCLYLHIQKKPTQTQSKSKIKGRMGRVMMVMNPLGIVTVTEFTFSLLFVALLTWALGNYLYLSYYVSLHNHDNAKIWQAKFRAFGLRIGYVGHYCWAFLFFPVTRASTILPLVGLTSESSIKYHIRLGHISNFLFLAHTVIFLIYWAMTNQLMETFAWNPTYVPNLAGAIAMVIGIVMWVTSFPYYRRKKFEIFFYTHHLYVLYIVFYMIHVGDSWLCMILPNMFLFFIDRYLRFLQSTKRSRLVSVRILPSDNLELTFAKTPGLQYTPTSILFLHVPSISKLQWHPFTITSNSNLEKDTLSVVIRRQGSWTQKLYTHISSSIDSLEVSTEGPYGPNSLDLRHDSLILVSGGSGVTPFISVIRELIFQTQNQSTKIPDVLLVCAFKHYHDLAFLDLIFPPDISVSDISRLNLRIEAYITQEDKKPEAADDQRLLQTKWFKPQPLDTPISPVLGPNNILWLGVVILSSFVMFLLLIVIVTRYYIYPVDHNTGSIYNFSYRVLWDMFLGCVCIFISSSAVFLWRKKVNKEGDKESKKQVQSVDFQTPMSSPGSWFCRHERELESVPYQSIVQATSVHFGSKPNLKKILFEAEGSEDVGVMVCGPRKMRHEVARICSSGLAKNLHFEAISFNW